MTQDFAPPVPDTPPMTAPPQVDVPDNDAVTKERLLEIALFLWNRLDDIDTMDDMVKGDDRAYRAHVQRLHRRRFEVGTTDGYDVGFFPENRTDHAR